MLHKSSPTSPVEVGGVCAQTNAIAHQNAVGTVGRFSLQLLLFCSSPKRLNHSMADCVWDAWP